MCWTTENDELVIPIQAESCQLFPCVVTVVCLQLSFHPCTGATIYSNLWIRCLHLATNAVQLARLRFHSMASWSLRIWIFALPDMASEGCTSYDKKLTTCPVKYLLCNVKSPGQYISASMLHLVDPASACIQFACWSFQCLISNRAHFEKMIELMWQYGLASMSLRRLFLDWAYGRVVWVPIFRSLLNEEALCSNSGTKRWNNLQNPDNDFSSFSSHGCFRS